MSSTYQVIRSDRRTLALSVDEQGALIVRAPRRMPMSVVTDFINAKQSWIEQKQAEARKRSEAARALKWTDGAAFAYLGGELTLRFAPVKAAQMQGGELLLPQEGDPATHARRWLMREAEAVMLPRVTYWARVTGCTPKRLLWSTAAKRWGSMTTQGVLRLNLALMHCPMEAIDYVIVHELAHMRHPDHSPAFHALVRRYLPDAEDRRRRMRDMTAYLQLIREATRP